MSKSEWVKEEVYDYVIKVGNNISDIKQELREATKEKFESASAMLSTPEQGELMKMMVQVSGAKKGIEIGTFTGYSALCLAEGLPDNGTLICLDINEEWTSFGKEYWKKAKVNNIIDLRIASAIESLDLIIDEKSNLETFDFAFIDADKPNYLEYYERLLKLIKPKGFIIIDNVLWKEHTVEDIESIDENTKALKEFNIFIREDDRVTHCMLPISDGISIWIKTLSGINPEYEFKRHVLSLVKAKILLKNTKEFDLCDSDQLKVNDGFKNKLHKLKVPLLNQKDQLDNDKKEVEPKVEDDRKHLIEATIVRVMKARKKLEHNQLISEVMKILSNIFQPTSIMIKQKIEGLIEKDYLMRDPDDRRVYLYRA